MIIDLGHIYSVWSYEYDHNQRVATLKLNLETLILNLSISEIKTKSGIGAGTKTVFIDNIEVGTLNKPNKGLIRSTLSKYKYNSSSISYPFSRNGWNIIDNDKSILIRDNTLDFLFDYYKNTDKVVSRILKLKKIKSKIKYIIKNN